MPHDIGPLPEHAQKITVKEAENNVNRRQWYQVPFLMPGLLCHTVPRKTLELCVSAGCILSLYFLFCFADRISWSALLLHHLHNKFPCQEQIKKTPSWFCLFCSFVLVSCAPLAGILNELYYILKNKCASGITWSHLYVWMSLIFVLIVIQYANSPYKSTALIDPKKQ